MRIIDATMHGRYRRWRGAPSQSRLLVVALVAGLAAGCGDDTPTSPTPQPQVQPFTIQCPADVLGQSPTGAPVSIQVPPPTTAGGVLPVTVSCAPTGTPFPVGSTRVSCQATDARSSAAACSFNVNVAPPPLTRTNFLAFGDSITAGEITVPTASPSAIDGFPNFRFVVVPSQSYPTQLLSAMRSRYTTQSAQFIVTNAGVPGEYVDIGARRFPGVLASANPQVLLLLEGGNDIQAIPTNLGVADALASLQSIVRAARTRGVTVFVASLPPPKAGGRLAIPLAIVQRFNDGVRSGAAAEGAVFVDVYGAMFPNVDTLIGSDGLHPTAAGYQRIADTFFAAIRNSFEAR